MVWKIADNITETMSNDLLCEKQVFNYHVDTIWVQDSKFLNHKHLTILL